MSKLHPGAYLCKNVDFLDATDEEIFDLVRNMVSELAIMTCFLTLSPGKKKAIQVSIASFQAYLGNRQSKH